MRRCSWGMVALVPLLGALGCGRTAGRERIGAASADAAPADAAPAELPAATRGRWFELAGSATGRGVSANEVEGTTPVVALDRAGQPLVAWRRAGEEAHLALRHWSGTGWQPLGGSDSPRGVGAYGATAAPAIALASDGKPVVAWPGIGVNVRRFTGRAWASYARESATSDGAIPATLTDSTDAAREPLLVFDRAGRAVLAWTHALSPSSAGLRAVIRLLRLASGDGSAEELAGSGTGKGLSSTSAGLALRASLVIDEQDRPVIAHVEYSNGTRTARVVRFAGQAWETLFEERDNQDLGLALATAPDGRVVLARWRDGETRVRRHEGDRWVELGPPAAAARGPMTVDEKGRVLLAWVAGRELVVSRLEDGRWVELAGPASTSTTTATAGFALAPSIATHGERICVTWVASAAADVPRGAIHLRCFDGDNPACACDLSPACEAGCTCDRACARRPAPVRCPDGQFHCDDGACREKVVVCNGLRDCGDGSDESPLCPGQPLLDRVRGTCTGGFACADGRCPARRCDQRVDCPDGSDEDASCHAATAWIKEAIGLGAELTPVERLASAPSGLWATAGPAVLRRQSGRWERVTLPAGRMAVYPSALWATGGAFAVAADVEGFLLWDGTWRLAPVAPAVYLGLWGTSATDVWAVGHAIADRTVGEKTGASLVHFDGARWTETAPPGLSDSFWRVAGSDPNDVWAVGEKGAIVHWNGRAWERVASGTTEALFGIWAASPELAWAVGHAGVILRWTRAGGWQKDQPVTNVSLLSVWGRGPAEVWAAGLDGTLLRHDGARWRHEWIGTAANLHDVGGDTEATYVVGAEAALFSLPRR